MTMRVVEQGAAMRIGALDQVLTGLRDAVRWDVHYSIAQELGFDGVELGVRANYDQTQLWDRMGRQEILRLSQQAGVVTSSVCLHSYWQYSFAHPDADIRVRARRIAEEAAQAIAEVGAKRVLIPLTCPDGVEQVAARERWVEGMRSCAEAAESNGVFFCLENVGKPFGNTPERIVEIVDSINSPAVEVYYDPGNAVHNGLDPLRGIELLGKRIGQVHVKEIGGKLLGDGAVPWPQIIAGLRMVGYDGWLVLETDPTDDPKTAALQNLRTLQKLVQA